MSVLSFSLLGDGEWTFQGRSSEGITAVRVVLRSESKAGETTQFPDWWPRVPRGTGRGRLTPFHQPAQAALVAGLQQCEMSPPGEEGHSGRDTPEVAKICT